jgi:hypothetical protein
MGRWAVAKARGLHCQNNLRELGKCARQYWADHGNVWPPMWALGRNGMVQTMADQGHLTLSESRHAGGYHWSIILWPYHRDLDLYVCPCDPRRDLRGDVTGQGLKAGSPFVDAPPESYGLNTMLFRSQPKLRRLAGASWGLKAGEFQSPMTFTTRNDQRRAIGQLDRRILMFCGTAGCTVGHQSNTAWRDSGLAERYEWHPWPGPSAFEDGEAFGSYYLFFSGAAEYREAFPSRREWALDL